jgi:hypothetical protein
MSMTANDMTANDMTANDMTGMTLRAGITGRLNNSFVGRQRYVR